MATLPTIVGPQAFPAGADQPDPFLLLIAQSALPLAGSINLPFNRPALPWWPPGILAIATKCAKSLTSQVRGKNSALEIALQKPGIQVSLQSPKQLNLLVQPQGRCRWLAERSVAFGLGLSLAGFTGCSLIALSSLFENGTILVLADGTMAFAQEPEPSGLPTATEIALEATRTPWLANGMTFKVNLRDQTNRTHTKD